MFRNTCCRFCGCSVVVLLLCLLLGPGPVVVAADSPSPDGKQLVHAACTQCHGLRPIVEARDGTAGWRDTVQKMVIIGAQLNHGEIDRTVEYLASQYGPAAGPMTTGTLPPDSILAPGRMSKEIELPDGKGKDLVQAYCRMCHDLGRVVIDRRSEADWRRYVVNMMAQAGMELTDDDRNTMVNYLTGHFGTELD